MKRARAAIRLHFILYCYFRAAELIRRRVSFTKNVHIWHGFHCVLSISTQNKLSTGRCSRNACCRHLYRKTLLPYLLGGKKLKKNFSRQSQNISRHILGPESSLNTVPKIDFLLSSFFFFFLVFSRAAPTAYGGPQARVLIRAVAAGLCQSHSNAGSEPHLRPTHSSQQRRIPNPLNKTRDRTHNLMVPIQIR